MTNEELSKLTTADLRARALSVAGTFAITDIEGYMARIALRLLDENDQLRSALIAACEALRQEIYEH